MKKFFIIFILLVFFSSCEKKTMSPLDLTLKELEMSIPEKDLKEFLKNSDNISQMHFGFGIDFRNENFRSPKDSTLIKFFNSQGIFHEDYMSEIVFTSLYRKLNNKPIDLDKQLKTIRSQMNKVKSLENTNTKRALKYYNKYQIGDTIVIRRPINDSYAVQYAYPEDSGWIFNDTLDLLIEGVIKEKNKIKDTLDIFFKLKILSSNHDNIEDLLRNIENGNEIKGDFRLDIIEDKKLDTELNKIK